MGAAIWVASLAVLVPGRWPRAWARASASAQARRKSPPPAQPDRRGEVTSTFFVVLHVAISIPVIGVGVAANELGLRTAGSGFAVALLSLVALAALAFGSRSRGKH